jgi:MerR family mercuric resistance operon transcriptional regulator
MMEQYTIGVLAKQTAVNVETIRYYQRRGLVEEPPRPLGGARRYNEVHTRRLRFIRQAQTLGFSLDEVAELLALEDGRHCHEAEALGSAKLATVRERIAQLHRVETVLATLVDQCVCNAGNVRCPLVGALAGDEMQPTGLTKTAANPIAPFRPL